MKIPQQRVYYAVFIIASSYTSLDDAMNKDPDIVKAHIARSKNLHTRGTLLMAGGFLNNPNEPLSAMAIHTTYAAAEEFALDDPFVTRGKAQTWYIREWINMFAEETETAE